MKVSYGDAASVPCNALWRSAFVLTLAEVYEENLLAFFKLIGCAFESRTVHEGAAAV